MALLAVGLGGWSLLSLSERRIRFVSAVTHELRTPLTTLQLYLDMLLGGLVRDEKQRTEYLQTLHAETDRLTRLVGNVLDFSRLENHQPRLMMGPVAVADRAGAGADGLEPPLRRRGQGTARGERLRPGDDGADRRAGCSSRCWATCSTTPASTAARRRIAASGCGRDRRAGGWCSRWKIAVRACRSGERAHDLPRLPPRPGRPTRRRAASAWVWRWPGAGRACWAAG